MMRGIAGVELPATWKWQQLRHVTTVLRRGTPPDYLDEGPVRVLSQAANQWDGWDWSRTRFHYLSGKVQDLKGYLKPHDIVINATGIGTVGRVGYFPGGPDAKLCIADGHLAIARTVPDDSHPRFAYYYLSSTLFQHYLASSLVAGATNQVELNTDRLGSAPIALPPIEEQRRIADFLDAETNRLSEMETLKRKSRELTTERIISVVDQLIRGTRDPSKVPADYRPLGEVPRSWVQGRLRNVPCEVQTGPFGSQLHADDYIEDGWAVVNPANITPNGLVKDPQMTIDAHAHARLSRHILHAGDVVFGRRGELGRAAVVLPEQHGWVCGTGSLRVRFTRTFFEPGYLKRYLGIPAVRHYFQKESVGSTMQNLNSSILLDMPLLMPGRSEQNRIVKECEQAETGMAQLIDQINRQLNLLAERRQALITAAVTGQLDVTTARSGVR